MPSTAHRPNPLARTGACAYSIKEPAIRDRNVMSIVAEGVLDEFDYDIHFGANDDAGRVRVVYAPNGRGKTNLLRAVGALLSPSLESLQALIDIPVRSLDVTFRDESRIYIRRDKAFQGTYTVGIHSPRSSDPSVEDAEEGDVEVALTIEPSDFSGRLYRRVWDERADFSRFTQLANEASTGVSFIGDDRLAVSAEDTRESLRNDVRKRSAGSVSRLLERVELMLSQSAFAGIAGERASLGVYAQITRTTLAGSQNLSSSEARASLERQIADLKKAGQAYAQYGLLSLNQLNEISTQLLVARSNHRQLPTLHRILKPYLDSVQAQIDSLKPALQLIDAFVTGVNSFIDRKELLFSTAFGISLRSHDGVTLQPDSLSSGERHLIYLMSQAILATTDRPLVIIDEPELSLGIEWQRNLIPELLACTATAGVQFLVASHSLQVMNAVVRTDIIHPTEGS